MQDQTLSWLFSWFVAFWTRSHSFGNTLELGQVSQCLKPRQATHLVTLGLRWIGSNALTSSLAWFQWLSAQPTRTLPLNLLEGQPSPTFEGCFLPQLQPREGKCLGRLGPQRYLQSQRYLWYHPNLVLWSHSWRLSFKRKNAAQLLVFRRWIEQAYTFRPDWDQSVMPQHFT